MDDKLAKEIAESRYSVMVRGLPTHKDTKQNETKEQTWDKCDQFLYQLGIENEVEVVRVKRYPSDETRKNIPPTLKIEFRSLGHKSIFYQAVAEAGKKGWTVAKGISVSDEIPTLLRGQQKTLEARSYQLRKIDRGYKPRIIVTNKELGIKFWIQGEDEAQVYLHKDLAELDEFIQEIKPDGLDITIDPNYGKRNTPPTNRGGAARRGGGRGRGRARAMGASTQ